MTHPRSSSPTQPSRTPGALSCAGWARVYRCSASVLGANLPNFRLSSVLLLVVVLLVPGAGPPF